MKTLLVMIIVILCLFMFTSLFTICIIADQNNTTASNADWWLMFCHDLAHTGYSNSTAPNTNQTLWNYTTKGQVWSSPAVSNGMVYIGSNDHKVYALNATTGAPIWNYTSSNNVYSSLAVAGGMVYVGSTDHNVYALNASTGVLVWNYRTSSNIYSSPAVANGIIYIGSNDHNVYAFGALATLKPTLSTSIAITN